MNANMHQRRIASARPDRNASDMAGEREAVPGRSAASHQGKARHPTRWCVTVLAASVVVMACAAMPRAPRDVELEQKVAQARTRVDHEELASVYDQLAKENRRAADKHQALSVSYDRMPPWSLSLQGLNAAMAQHCENLARHYRKAAQENETLAMQHRGLAAEAPK